MANSGTFCTNCGTQNDSSARFCVKCGTPSSVANPTYAPSPRPRGFSCPYCATEMPPTTKRSMTTVSWVVFIVLLLVDFLLAPLAFLIKEERRICSSCGVKLGG